MLTVDEAEKVLGVELMPWQRKLVQAILNGERVVAYRGRRVALTTECRVIETAAPSSPNSGEAN